MKVLAKFNQDVKTKRKAKKFTQETVAVGIGSSPRYVQYIEAGKVPSTEIFLRLCFFLELDPSTYKEELMQAVPVYPE